MPEPLIPTGERSGLQTRIVTTKAVVVRADEKLTTLVEPNKTGGSERSGRRSGIISENGRIGLDQLWEARLCERSA